MDYPLVTFTWIDAERTNDWLPLGLVLEPLPRIVTTGYLIEETEEYVSVVMSVDEKNGNGDSRMRIPKCSIVERVNPITGEE